MARAAKKKARASKKDAVLALGGSDKNSEIRLTNADGDLCVLIDGGNSNYTAGGHGSGEGNVTLGGGGHDGDIIMKTSSAVTRIELEAHNSNIRANDKSGKTTVEIIGGTGEIKVKGKKLKGADHVFADDYALAPLSEVATFVAAHRHLPGIATAKAMQADGVGMTELAMQLLEKVEELTLHAIAQDKRIAGLERKLRQ